MSKIDDVRNHAKAVRAGQVSKKHAPKKDEEVTPPENEGEEVVAPPVEPIKKKTNKKK